MKKLLYACIPVFLVVVGVFAFTTYQNTFQKLTITYAAGIPSIETNLYRFDHDSDATTTKGDFIQKITATSTLRLKKGGYKLVFNGTNDLEKFETVTSVTKDPATITVNPDFSDAKKAGILSSAQPLIEKLITTQYPLTSQLYTFEKGTLYNQASWFGTTLTPKDSNPSQSADVLRVVAKKAGNGWELVTKPPQIIISGVVYPDIPKDIVRDLNNR